MSWRRLGVLVRALPETSRSHQAHLGERWGRTDNLLAGVYDLLAAANWQRAGDKRVKRPEPLSRPGLNRGPRYGTKSMSIDQWRERYAARFPERGDARGCRAG